MIRNSLIYFLQNLLRVKDTCCILLYYYLPSKKNMLKSYTFCQYCSIHGMAICHTLCQYIKRKLKIVLYLQSSHVIPGCRDKICAYVPQKDLYVSYNIQTRYPAIYITFHQSYCCIFFYVIFFFFFEIRRGKKFYQKRKQLIQILFILNRCIRIAYT